MSRRRDASYLARLVVEHRIFDDQAGQIIHDLVTTVPWKVFSLTGEAS